MKLLLFLLFPFLLFSQNNIQIEVHQDLRLMTLGDDRGNNPFTPDFKIGVALQGKQFKYYYFEIKPSFEYVELSGGKYVMWQVNGGWVFNNLVVPRFEIGFYLTGGILHRFDLSYLAYGFTEELSYKINKKIKVGIMLQHISRPDLKYRWGSNGLKTSLYIGLKYNLKQ